MFVQPASEHALTQGDIISDCPIVTWQFEEGSSRGWVVESRERVVVLTQACDLANEKTTRVQVAVVHEAQRLVSAGVVKASVIKDQVRNHRVFGWYFLPESTGIFPESIVDLRDIHTLPKRVLESLCREGQRLVRIETPYREHLA